MGDEVSIGVTIDCRDAGSLAEFWRSAIQYDLAPARPGVTWRTLRRPASASGPNHLHFQTVAEGKEVKNRVHLDLFVDDLDAEVSRHQSLGAIRAEGITGAGYNQRNVVLLDPEGNEYCLVQRRSAT